MFVKPAEGLKVRDPHTKAWIPAEGIEVPAGDLEFARMLADGDVVETEKPPEPPAETPPPAEAPPPAVKTPKAAAADGAPQE